MHERLVFRVVAFAAATAGLAGLECPADAQIGPALERDTSPALVPMGIDSGPILSDPGAGPAFETVVRVPGAAWLRLTFGPTTLAGDPACESGARVRVRSLLDGSEQTLNAETLADWGSTSAYFNGEAVSVELLAGRGEEPGASRLRVDSVTAGWGVPALGLRSICEDVDDRTLSADPRVGRLLPLGCTAWLFDDRNSTFLTAGHCAPAAGSVVQFNVPLSTSSGGLVHPPPQDQYPVEPGSVQSQAAGPGDDWAYFACYPSDASRLTAFQTQGHRFALGVARAPVSGQRIRITGFATVSAPVSPTWYRAQKTHAGEYRALVGTVVHYHTDTTEGNSGSPVIDELSGRSIGIHVYSGCSSAVASANRGTASQQLNLRAALAAPRGLCASGSGAFSPPLYAAGDLNNSFGTLNLATGAFAAIAPGPTAAQGLAYDPGRGVFYATDWSSRLLTVTPAGAVETIGTVTGAGGAVTGLGFDAGSRTLYGMVQAGGQLVRIDPTTAAATPIGPARGGNIGALEFDPLRNTLYSLDDTPVGTVLVRVSVSDGARTIVGPLGVGIADCNGLAWCALDGALYTVDSATENLLRIDAATGAASLRLPTGGVFGAALGLACSYAWGCGADYDGSGTTTIDDLFSFLVGWFAREPAADTDGSGQVGVEDLFAFLAVWFSGC